jgi:hypothetical protein
VLGTKGYIVVVVVVDDSNQAAGQPLFHPIVTKFGL